MIFVKVTTIINIIEGCLLSVLYDDKEKDEFRYIMEYWNDVEYLRSFFMEQKSHLNDGFYRNISISEAVRKTIEEAKELEEYIKRTAKKGKLDASYTLQSIFKPLNDNEYTIKLHQKTKTKGLNKKSWLRVYAIRIAPNMFVITGGGIKLTKTMNESEHLQTELHKLELTKSYLKEVGLLDENDYQFLEF